MSDKTFEEKRDREDDVRDAVNAADDTGMVRQAEILVQHDLSPVADDEPEDAVPADDAAAGRS